MKQSWNTSWNSGTGTPTGVGAPWLGVLARRSLDQSVKKK